MSRPSPRSRVPSSRPRHRSPLSLQPLEDRSTPAGGTITGTVFLDGNLNGCQDPGETGTSSSPVSVFAELSPGNGQFDPGEPVATANSTDGTFTLSIPTGQGGDYVVRIVSGSGVQPTGPVSSLVTVSDGAVVPLSVPLGYTRMGGMVTAGVFLDSNGNGVQESTEFGAFPAGFFARIGADLNNNGVLDAGEPSAQTQGVSLWLQMYVPVDGPCTILADVPAGYALTTPAASPVYLQAGSSVFAGEIGVRQTAGGVIRGTVFYDTNGDGGRAPGEPATPDVAAPLVYLDLNANGVFDYGAEPAAAPGPDGSFVIPTPAVDSTYLVRLDTTGLSGASTTPLPLAVAVSSGGAQTVSIGWQATAGGILTGSVFNDANGNGTRDTGEGLPAMNGLVVFDDVNNDGVFENGESIALIASDGTFTLAVNTDRSVRPWVESFSGAIAPFTVTTPNPGLVALTGGAVRTVPAFGLQADTRVSGLVYSDLNGNGAWDMDPDTLAPTEPGQGGATVYADLNGNGVSDPGEPTTVSDGGGAFTITLPAGTYTVRTVTGSGQMRTGPDPRVTVEPGTTGTVPPMGVVSAVGRVTGSVFLDANANGVKDGPEGATNESAGVRAYADLNGNGSLDPGEPAADVTPGRTYTLYVPLAGTFPIRLSGPAGVQLTTTPAVASVGGGNTATASPIGYRRVGGTVFVTVFNDANGNGTYEPANDTTVVAPGVSGVTVYADLNGNGALDSGEPSTTTDSPGGLVLLQDGTYTIRTVAPTGFIASGPATVTVALAGGNTQTATLGLKLTAGGYVSGTLYYDSNGNGVHDPGEGGFGGSSVQVYLDANGNAAFDAGESGAAPDATGAFVLTSPPVDGSYLARLVFLPASAVVTGLVPARSTLSGGAPGVPLDVGVRAVTGGLVRGAVFLDANGDGVQGAGEGPVPAGSVFVYDDLNGNGVLDLGTEPILGTVAADGSFAVLAGGDGAHRIRVTSSPYSGSDRLFVQTTQGPAPVTVSAGAVQTGLVLGGQLLTAIRGTVFDDQNGNEDWDNDPSLPSVEQGLGGVTVYADLNGNGARDGGEPSAVTDTTGAYEILVSGGGTYAIRAVVPPNRAPTTTTQPTTAVVGAVADAAPIGLRPNTAPTVTGLAAPAEVTPGAVPASVTFTVGDAESGPAGLTVTVAPSSPGLFPFTVSGTGATRTIAFSGNTAQPGSSTSFTVTVSDGYLSTSAGFSISVTPAPTPPTPPAPQPSAPAVVPQVAVGSDTGEAVTVYNPDGTTAYSVTPFPGATGGVRTATADFNADGVPDVVAGTGPGSPAQVCVIDTRTGQTLFSSAVFEGFSGGVFVAAGDLDGDGRPELVVTPDEGGGPRVLIFDGNGFRQVASFFGIDDPAFHGGARAAVGDINGDGRPDLLVSAGFGGGPRVAGYDGAALAEGRLVKLFSDFFAFEPELRNGVYLAVGDLDGDGYGDLIAGAGPGGGPRVLGLSGADLVAGQGNRSRVLANFFGGDLQNRGGIRVAVKNLDGDGLADLVVGAGAGTSGRVAAYLGRNVRPTGTPPEFQGLAELPGVDGGVFVG